MPDPSHHRRSGGRGAGLLAAARIVSVAEATSFLLLLVAAVVKRTADHPEGVQVLGPIHGVLFLAYCVLVIAVAVYAHWPARRTALALGASVLPVAPYVVERRWLRTPTAAPDTAPVAGSGNHTAAVDSPTPAAPR